MTKPGNSFYKDYRAEYQALHNAIWRTTSPACPWYDLYGGRGIKVDPAFLGPNGMANFMAEAGERPGPEYSLDRIDVDGDYTFGNLRWSLPCEQRRNQRGAAQQKIDLGWGTGELTWVDSMGRTITRKIALIEHEGQVRTVAEWADLIGVSRGTIRARLRAGFSAADALAPHLFSSGVTPRGSGRRERRAGAAVKRPLAVRMAEGTLRSRAAAAQLSPPTFTSDERP